jgi:hypothetical protein
VEFVTRSSTSCAPIASRHDLAGLYPKIIALANKASSKRTLKRFSINHSGGVLEIVSARLQARRVVYTFLRMVIRTASIVLSLAGLLALILGLLFWTGAALNLLSMHMLLGLLAVCALWVIGIAQAIAKGGSWIIAVCALIIGAVMIVLGMIQSTLMIGELHWVVQVVHLILGILTIGIGHMAAARYRKGSAA